MSKNRFLPFLLIACAPLVTACSTVTNGSMQQVKVRTIGADDAYCTMLIGENEYRYVARPPQTMWIQRSKKPLYINCNAPGNRSVSTKVSSNLAEATYMNTLTAGTTLPWDAATGAMYEWPGEIVIDFTDSFAKDQPLPSYENRGALDPKAQGVEYLGEDTPSLPGDADRAARYKAAYDEAAREDAEAAANAAERERRINAVEGGFYGDKDGSYRSSAPAAVNPAPQKTSGSQVQINPLSEAAPVAATSLTTKAPTANSSEPITVPLSNPQLGKPIFPNSTTFNR